MSREENKKTYFKNIKITITRQCEDALLGFFQPMIRVCLTNSDCAEQLLLDANCSPLFYISFTLSPSKILLRYKIYFICSMRKAHTSKNFGAGRVKSVPSTRWWISPLASVQVTLFFYKSMPPAR